MTGCCTRSAVAAPTKAAWILLARTLALAHGQFTAQVLIEPTVDPLSVFATVQTLSGPTAGVNRAGWSDGPGNMAKYNSPAGVVGGSDGDVYVADTRNHVLRRVYWNGWAETIAGKAGEFGLRDGQGEDARFFSPSAVSIGPDGEIYVADTSNHAIRRVSSTGAVVTLFAAQSCVTAEMRDPLGSSIMPRGLWNPAGIAVWPSLGGTSVTLRGDFPPANLSRTRCRFGAPSDGPPLTNGGAPSPSGPPIEE